MKTSELPNGTIIKFKNPARLHSFYDRVPNYDWSTHDQGSLKTIDFCVGDVLAIIKTSMKNEHVGQTVLLPTGSTKVIYYIKGTFFDENKGSLGNVDLTLSDWYYDVIES